MLRAALAAAILSAAPHPDALRIVDNVVRHEGPPPPYAAALVRELFSRPLDARDASAIFERSVPRELVQGLRGGMQVRPFDEVLREYLKELEKAQAELRAATGEIDAGPVLRRLNDGLPSADRFLILASGMDQKALARANASFVEATLRFARDVRVASNFPPQAMTLDSPVGVVSIGTRGDDRHGPDAALIIDPGGDDVYERSPVTNGSVSVIVDLGGNDRYGGGDVVIRGFSAIVDFAGDDRYEMNGPGIAAAMAGASLVVDREGNDRYRSGYFSQGAAAFGLGALVDEAGDDDYRIGGWGQGFGAAGGVGLLWDRGGNDAYSAAGEADSFGRDAALSGAQGAAFGFRTLLGGGTGILRDEAGDDRYEAQMFAQGLGYYYGVGVLWDEDGNDRYRAVRYAQGAAAHEGVGVLRDERGDDRYELSFGVGQGMGLDLALGVLVDASGDDDYRAPLIAQGTATANGIGIFSDVEGINRLEVRDPGSSWGDADAHSGLPSVGVFSVNRSTTLVRTGNAPPPAEPARCPAVDVDELRKNVASLRRDYLDAVLAVGRDLRCALEARPELWDDVRRLLERDPETPLAASIAEALEARPDRELLEKLGKHPSCAVRARALVSQPVEEKARDALRSSCYRLQAAGVRALRALGLNVPPDAPLPAFLRASPPSARCLPGDPCPLPAD